MRKLLLLLFFGCFFGKGHTQSFEVQQLILNIEKLAQFKQVLQDLKKGYQILLSGYTIIRDVSQGNFQLHYLFLDALLQVSPTVRNYYKVGQIISLQIRLVKEYKSAWNRFRSQPQFTATEIKYIAGVYERLVQSSLRNLDDLLLVITARQLRMSDTERLEAIDQLHADMESKVIFLRQFNSNNSILSIQRQREQHDVDIMKRVYAIP